MPCSIINWWKEASHVIKGNIQSKCNVDMPTVTISNCLKIILHEKASTSKNFAPKIILKDVEN